MMYRFEKSGQLTAPTPEELAAADADASVLVLNQGVMKDGTPYWFYVAVKPGKYREFREATEALKPVRLEDYGVILKSGNEADVPDAVREEMKREHGFDEQFMVTLTKNVLEAQLVFLKQQEAHRIDDIVAMLKKNQGG